MKSNQLDQILSEQNYEKPIIIQHKNGKTFEAKHVRLIKTGYCGSYVLVVGFGDGPGPIINHRKTPPITYRLADFYHTWYEKIGHSKKKHWSSRLRFRKIITMNPKNVANLKEIIKRLSAFQA